jgi:hypothetical protein
MWVDKSIGRTHRRQDIPFSTVSDWMQRILGETEPLPCGGYFENRNRHRAIQPNLWLKEDFVA